jgi:hypothetical protein
MTSTALEHLPRGTNGAGKATTGPAARAVAILPIDRIRHTKASPTRSSPRCPLQVNFPPSARPVGRYSDCNVHLVPLPHYAPSNRERASYQRPVQRNDASPSFIPRPPPAVPPHPREVGLLNRIAPRHSAPAGSLTDPYFNGRKHEAPPEEDRGSSKKPRLEDRVAYVPPARSLSSLRLNPALHLRSRGKHRHLIFLLRGKHCLARLLPGRAHPTILPPDRTRLLDTILPLDMSLLAPPRAPIPAQDPATLRQAGRTSPDTARTTPRGETHGAARPP